MTSKVKFVSLALVFLLMLSFVVGCTGTKPSDSGDIQKGEGNKADVKEGDKTGGDDEDENLTTARETITIRLAADGLYEFDPSKDELAKFIVDKFGIIFENVGYEGDMEKMMLDASSGELADIAYTEPLYALYEFATFINNGFFRSIPDEMLAKYPNIKTAIDESEVCAAVKDHYGDNYMLPKPDSRDPKIYIGERKGIYYRKDWLENVGITKEPETWEELYEMAKAFTLKDPDQNGKNDTYGLTSDGFGNFRFSMANVGHSNLNWVKGPDGRWTHGALLEDNIEVLEWFRKMYEEGYLDPEFGSIDHVQAMQKFASETFGALSRNADADWLNTVIVKQFYAANAEKYPDPFAVVGVIPVLAKDANSKPGIDKYIDTMCAAQVASTVSDEKLERYLEFHDYFITDEGELYRLGFEDKDWKRDSDGKIEKILDGEGLPPNLGALYPSMPVINMGSWGFHLAANPSIPTYDLFNDETKALNMDLIAKRNPNAVPSDMRIKLISEQSMLDANSFKFSVEYSNIISGKEPIDKMFKDMVQRAMNSGFKEAIEDVNRVANEKGWD